MGEAPLVSCLCVTRNRVPMLKRAVSCFLDQTYRPRELVVLHESDDPATRDYLATLGDPAIRALEVSATPKLNLGALRNLSIDAARGRYIAQWDDDDWHGPTRLTDQIHAIAASGKSGCLLSRWVLFDESTRMAYLSGHRAWEGSLVAERKAVPRYADLRQGEDTGAIDLMLTSDAIALLDSPDLYVYVYHGTNTWERAHWQSNILPFARPLPPDATRRVESVLRR